MRAYSGIMNLQDNLSYFCRIIKNRSDVFVWQGYALTADAGPSWETVSGLVMLRLFHVHTNYRFYRQMQELSLPCPFEQDVDLREKSYYRIGGRTRFFAMPQTLQHLGDLLLWNHDQDLPLAVMGSGSNMLFSDEPFSGIVVAMEMMNRMFWVSPGELFCEAGIENTAIAAELLRCGRGGGEWLHMLPGRIGGTIRMNARCFGGEISGVTASVVTMDMRGRLRWLPGNEVFLGYKQTSLMAGREIVVAALLRFPVSKAPEEIRAEMGRYEEERLRKHHFDFPSCGSTFKNNYGAGRPSGQIFEELGFKGQQEGGAAVSGYHANFIYNTGKASSSDVLALAGRMRKAARDKSGVELELEVECTGIFERDQLNACGVPFVPADADSGKGWAGLLRSPGQDSSRSDSNSVFPQTLLHGYLTGYFGDNGSFPPGISVHVEQLHSIAYAESNPLMPFLRWTTRADSEPFSADRSRVVGAPPSGIFVDELWRFPVSELFIGYGVRVAGYLEFEMRPSGDWVALRFNDRRIREAGFAVLSSESWRGDVDRFADRDGFGMTFSFRLLYPFLEKNRLSLQCCASLGDQRYGLFPWWKTASETPDFHQPDRFLRVRLTS